MSRLSKWIAICVLALLAQTATAQDSAPYCINSSPGTCRLPIYAVLARSPADFEGLGVWTAGFLIRHRESFYLFPSEEWSKMAYFDNALQILPRHEEDAEELRRLAGRLVFAVGEVDAECALTCWGSLRLVKEPYAVAFVGDRD